MADLVNLVHFGYIFTFPTLKTRTISVANPCGPLGRIVYIVMRARSADANRPGNSNMRATSGFKAVQGISRDATKMNL